MICSQSDKPSLLRLLEYTDDISADGLYPSPKKKYPSYDIKPSNGEVTVLDLWEYVIVP